MLWGAHAPRVQISAPSPKCFACNQREGRTVCITKFAIARTLSPGRRGDGAPRNSVAMLLKSSCPSR